jgi:hypothetical protein
LEIGRLEGFDRKARNVRERNKVENEEPASKIRAS